VIRIIFCFTFILLFGSFNNAQANPPSMYDPEGIRLAITEYFRIYNNEPLPQESTNTLPSTQLEFGKVDPSAFPFPPNPQMAGMPTVNPFNTKQELAKSTASLIAELNAVQYNDMIVDLMAEYGANRKNREAIEVLFLQMLSGASLNPDSDKIIKEYASLSRLYEELTEVEKHQADPLTNILDDAFTIWGIFYFAPGAFGGTKALYTGYKSGTRGIPLMRNFFTTAYRSTPTASRSFRIGMMVGIPFGSIRELIRYSSLTHVDRINPLKQISNVQKGVMIGLEYDLAIMTETTLDLNEDKINEILSENPQFFTQMNQQLIENLLEVEQLKKSMPGELARLQGMDQDIKAMISHITLLKYQHQSRK